MSAAAKEYIVAARKFAAQFKGFLSFADELEKLESVEQSIQEAKQRLLVLWQQEEDQRAAHKEREDHSLAEAARVITEAHEAANEIRRQAEQDKAAARAEVANACDAAVARAHDIVETAQREAEQHQHVAQTAREKLFDLERKIEALLEHHADLDVKTTAKTAELERIEAARATALAGLGFAVR